MLEDGTGNLYIHVLFGGPRDGDEIPAMVPYDKLTIGRHLYVKDTEAHVEPRQRFEVLNCKHPDESYTPTTIGVVMRYRGVSMTSENLPNESRPDPGTDS